ncbi:MAG: 50S ribosomal protein L25/general stress protein Ctc [Syntrophobacterales bacterium]|nr:50S ribosomal protein L25/general stress protein Ctc [Syntrophobacterales bacterium]
MEAIALRASARNTSGKGPARRARANGLIPAVFYNPKAEAVMLTVNNRQMMELLKKSDENVFINLQIEDGERVLERMSIIKDIQQDPLTGQILHVDFYEISMDHKLTVAVPVHFTGSPAGVKLGGELQILKREVSLTCLPSALPEHIAVDISHLKVGEALRVGSLPVPEGVTILDAEDAILAMVSVTRAAMKAEAEAEESEEAPKEPEILKQKAKEQ